MAQLIIKNGENFLEVEIGKTGLENTDRVVDSSRLQELGIETYENKSVDITHTGRFFYFIGAEFKAAKLGADYVQISQLQEKSKMLNSSNLKMKCVLTMYKLKE